MDIGHVIIYVIYITSIKYILDTTYRKKGFNKNTLTNMMSKGKRKPQNTYSIKPLYKV